MNPPLLLATPPAPSMVPSIPTVVPHSQFRPARPLHRPARLYLVIPALLRSIRPAATAQPLLDPSAPVRHPRALQVPAHRCIPVQLLHTKLVVHWLPLVSRLQCFCKRDQFLNTNINSSAPGQQSKVWESHWRLRELPGLFNSTGGAENVLTYISCLA